MKTNILSRCRILLWCFYIRNSLLLLARRFHVCGLWRRRSNKYSHAQLADISKWVSGPQIVIETTTEKTHFNLKPSKVLFIAVLRCALCIVIMRLNQGNKMMLYGPHHKMIMYRDCVLQRFTCAIGDALFKSKADWYEHELSYILFCRGVSLLLNIHFIIIYHSDNT